MKRVLTWLKAARAPFFADVMLCACLGAAVAWHETGAFDALGLAIALAGVILLNAGTNLANDYYDHRSGADEANPSPTPFSGGARAIQDGVLSAGRIRFAAFLMFALAACLGAAATILYGWPILVFGAVGALSGFFYTAPPFRLGYRGAGEFLAGLNVGPVAVLGSYYVQTGAVSWGAAAISLVPGFLSSALLVMNEIPDAAPDGAVGKRHLVARGRIERAPWAYLALVAGAFGWAVAAAGLRLAPATSLLVLMAWPLGLWAFVRARRHLGSPRGLVAAMAANVACVVASGALLCAGYLVAGVGRG